MVKAFKVKVIKVYKNVLFIIGNITKYFCYYNLNVLVVSFIKDKHESI